MSQSPAQSPPQPHNRTPPSDVDLTQDYTARAQTLVLQCTLSKDRHELAELRAHLSECLDAQTRLHQQLKHRLVNLENGNKRPRKRPCRNKRTDGVTVKSIDFTLQELEARAHRIGRKYVILCGPFINTGSGNVESFVNTPFDEDYNPQMRFSSNDDIRQGQLCELHNIVSDELAPFLTCSWFAKAFFNGMKSQCSNTHTRLPLRRISYFHRLVREKWYSIWDIPILHGNESSEVDFDEVFRHPMLLKVYAAIIRGVKSATSVMDGTSHLPKANAMQWIFGITNTTPGAIAACAVWVIWLFSADDDFAPVGEETTINYCDQHDKYLSKILEGLRLRQKWAQELFLFWDSHLFPDTNGSRFSDGLSADHEEDREEMNRTSELLSTMPVISDDDGGSGSSSA
ncbi:hypothetical protein DFH08DRAFT_972793 [Mycena albidolilacea]|uniref:Uncharacterized protein n=1 Tax=Mycena albidolilacea TaxID=1033008 RepID=A0AAD6ZA18_9AGAR|nr:hypothetical protein DFH08DRAFT_972793 [Mycena albidolilacea]